MASTESGPRAGVKFNVLSCACSGAVLCSLWGVASVLFPIFTSLCRPRKLSVGLSRLMRSGTMERFNDDGGRLRFQTTLTGHTACLQFLTSPSTHVGIKQVHNKISDRVKKKLHRISVALERVSLPWQPPSLLPDTLPHSWQQQTKRADFSGLRRGRPAFDLSPLRRNRVWGSQAPRKI